MNAKRPVLIMAGGTGGHVFPALAVAECLRAHGAPVRLDGGARRGLEATLVPKAGIPMEWIDVAGLRGKGLRQRLLMPFMLARALWQARILRRLQPVVVLGMGGFVSGPGGVMARLLGIPLVVHEQNAIAGLTNRFWRGWPIGCWKPFLEHFPPQRQATDGRQSGAPVYRRTAAARRTVCRAGRSDAVAGVGRQSGRAGAESTRAAGIGVAGGW
jgi:UDP-N-acetylglucosamine--N-acetylmuramyl-(pentapeptide) pyrophosphoryl-undecaprenol N-acetylglucosamine transferase